MESRFWEALKSSYWTPEEAEAVVSAWRESGESLTDFARSWSLKRDRVARWVDRLDEERLGAKEAMTFHPIQLVEPGSTRTSPATLRDPFLVARVEAGPFSVVVESGFDARELQRLLGVVGDLAC